LERQVAEGDHHERSHILKAACDPAKDGGVATLFLFNWVTVVSKQKKKVLTIDCLVEFNSSSILHKHVLSTQISIFFCFSGNE